MYFYSIPNMLVHNPNDLDSEQELQKQKNCLRNWDIQLLRLKIFTIK